MTLRAVITAGGTSEPIDDVRVVTNLSTGRFGAAIARALRARGVEVTLLAGKALARQPSWIPHGVDVVPFGSFVDLDRVLTKAVKEPPDLLFMAAAVSDYSPIPADGKIRSNADELTIRMVRNTKLLAELRDRCGPDTFIVGFKLLSRVSAEVLRTVAHKQAEDCSLDLTLANDLQHLEADRHPALMVSPDGASIAVDGTKDQTAARLVDHCLARMGAPTRIRATPPETWITRSRSEPILENGEVVGILTRHDRDYRSLFLFEHARSKGIGDRLVESWDSRVIATEDTAPWFVDRGFRITSRQHPLVFLDPPSMRVDLMPAASTCLIDMARRRVLIGRRRTRSFHGYWAFPGGRLDPAETLRQCAIRELAEETGLEPEVGDPIMVTKVAVSSDEGERAWEVTNFAWYCADPGEPVETAELVAEWVAIDELAQLRPMAAGTRRVLRKLLASLPATK